MKCFCNTWHIRKLHVMVLRLNKSLKYRDRIPTTDWSGPALTFDPFYSEYSTLHVALTLPEKTSFSCPESSCGKRISSV
jgi:hypothetical protein